MLRAAPALLPALAAAAPARVVKKLDADREVARAWTWTTLPDGGAVTTPGGETVTLSAEGGLVFEIVCSCLLTPRCFHVLAVAAVLEIAEGVASESEASPLATFDPGPRALDPSARDAARRAGVVAADVITAGASSVGTILEGELLRVVHLARVLGLHRLAGAGLRVVKDVRDLAAAADDFETATLVEDLRELCATAHRLDRDEVPVDAIGVARRAYDRVGHLRLVGVASEPVVARRGYGGIVTHVLDDAGGLWSIGDVMPGGEDRARAAYESSLAMGDTTITHRALSRSGLFVQDATASPDRRLGAGKDVKAVRASTDQGWAAPPIRARFDEPLAAQILRAYAALALPPDQTARGATLVFVRGRVVGHDDTALLLQEGADEGALRLIAPPSHGALSTFENLRQLASAEGIGLELVAHLVPEAPRTLALVAFGPSASDEDAPVRLVLPSAWRGVVNAGYDVIQGAHLDGRTSRAAASPHASVEAYDPLLSLRRRVERVALHGARSLPPEATAAVDLERAALQRLLMPGAADLLGSLAASARIGGGHSRRALHNAWLASATYARTASIALWRAGW